MPKKPRVPRGLGCPGPRVPRASGAQGLGCPRPCAHMRRNPSASTASARGCPDRFGSCHFRGSRRVAAFRRGNAVEVSERVSEVDARLTRGGSRGGSRASAPVQAAHNRGPPRSARRQSPGGWWRTFGCHSPPILGGPPAAQRQQHCTGAPTGVRASGVGPCAACARGAGRRGSSASIGPIGPADPCAAGARGAGRRGSSGSIGPMGSGSRGTSWRRRPVVPCLRSVRGAA